jgi:hypothetical protein
LSPTALRRRSPTGVSRAGVGKTLIIIVDENGNDFNVTTHDHLHATRPMPGVFHAAASKRAERNAIHKESNKRNSAKKFSR